MQFKRREFMSLLGGARLILRAGASDFLISCAVAGFSQ
jgi:hypothetical protein